MTEVKLGQIEDAKLAAAMHAALNCGDCSITYKLTHRKGMPVLEVFADIEPAIKELVMLACK
jgi:hypothetical protein